MGSNFYCSSVCISLGVWKELGETRMGVHKRIWNVDFRLGPCDKVDGLLRRSSKSEVDCRMEECKV